MRLGGKPLVLRAAEILRPFVREITLLAPADRYQNLGLPVVADQWPDQGPLAAICTGLLIFPCRLEYLSCLRSPPGQPAIHTAFGFSEFGPRVPMPWSRALRMVGSPFQPPIIPVAGPRLRGPFKKVERSIIRLLDEVRVEVITHDEMVSAGLSEVELTNLNTPEDWERIRELENWKLS